MLSSGDMKLNTALHSAACAYKELTVWGREPLSLVTGTIPGMYKRLRSTQDRERPSARRELSKEKFPETVPLKA